MRHVTKRTLAISLFTVVWVATVAFGARVLFHYENTPGQVGRVPQTWPSSQIERAKDRPTLVMLAHPHCPCTSSSVGELATIMARLHGRVAAYVLFVTPKESGTNWEETSLLRSAEAIPGVKIVLDRDGIEARQFGAKTSGHTFLFGADGGLLFSGGITASRGHAGENAGESSIVALTNLEVAPRTSTLVFGCSLVNRSETGLRTICLK